jgi:hypothetical protein
MQQPLSLEELKSEAKKRSHLVIRREGETAWRPLKTWKGHPDASVVDYLLVGNRVLARTGLKNEVHWYALG